MSYNGPFDVALSASLKYESISKNITNLWMSMLGMVRNECHGFSSNTNAWGSCQTVLLLLLLMQPFLTSTRLSIVTWLKHKYTGVSTKIYI
jgi:hypothetical protein